jgi:hypothetical protein
VAIVGAPVPARGGIAGPPAGAGAPASALAPATPVSIGGGATEPAAPAAVHAMLGVEDPATAEAPSIPPITPREIEAPVSPVSALQAANHSAAAAIPQTQARASIIAFPCSSPARPPAYQLSQKISVREWRCVCESVPWECASGSASLCWRIVVRVSANPLAARQTQSRQAKLVRQTD